MRTPITLKIKFKSSNLDQFIERYSVDVSRGGIFIRTKEPLPVGTQLRFEFQLQDASALIAGDGTVVWIREHDPARQGVAPGMGVRFDKLAPDSQKVLDRILNEKQKRGDAQLESRFDAGVRASASASGTLSSNKGHNDFSGGDSKSSFTPLPGAVPGLETPGDEFGNESTRVMQNELVQSLADRTRGQVQPHHDHSDRDDLANPFAEPEPTRKASVEELKLAVQGSAIEKAGETESKPAPKVEVAADAPKVEVAAKPEAKVDAKVEAKKEEPKVEAKVEAKKEEPKVEAKPEANVEEKKADAPEPKKEERKAQDRKDKKRSEKNGERKDSQRLDGHKDDAKSGGDGKNVKKADDKQPAATAAPFPKSEPPPRRRSNAVLYIGLGLVCAVGGYTVFRNNGEEEKQAPAQPQAAAATPAPEAQKVAQNDSPKPTENSAAAATATGDKPATATPAEQPNPAKPEKEPTAALDKPAGLTVSVASDPAGATVMLDGKPVEGQTPTTLSGLDAKKVYDVKLSMKGFHDWKVKLKPKAGEKLDAALVPNEKVVELTSTPAGADVVLDGKRVGKTPFTIHKLDLTKPHNVELKRNGFVTQTRAISATDAFEAKGDKDVLAVAMTLEAAEKPAVAEKPAAAAKPAVAVSVKRPAAKKPATAVKKPAESEKPAEATNDKPAESTDKPVVDKPAATEKPAAAAEKPAADKPVAEKPAATEKPAAAADKPAPEKPAEKPAAGIKVPTWMKQKPAEGGTPAPPPASDAPAP